MADQVEIIGAEDLREVRLYGHLAQRFGRIHRLAVRSCREAIEALKHLLPGFEAQVLKHNQPGYHVFGGVRKQANCRGENRLDAPLGRGEPVCIVPAVAGSKKAGVLQTVIGVVLIVAGVYFGQNWLVQAGVAMTIGGVAQMLTPVAKANESPKDSRLASYAFDGPVNSTQQGMPVPIVIGRMIVGSHVISQGLYSSDLA
jgi:predicted phage tail protein